MKRRRGAAKRGLPEPIDTSHERTDALAGELALLCNEVVMLKEEVVRLSRLCESINHVTSQLTGLSHRIESFDWIKHRLENIELYIGDSAEKAIKASHDSMVDSSTALVLVAALERQVDRLLGSEERINGVSQPAPTSRE